MIRGVKNQIHYLWIPIPSGFISQHLSDASAFTFDNDLYQIYLIIDALD
jgi:hypothetical protein